MVTRLDELEALLAKATPLPWQTIVDRYGGKEEAWGYWNSLGPLDECVCEKPSCLSDDLKLIAALRNLAPKLIAVAREAEEVADEFKREHPLVKALAALEEP